MRSLSLIVLFTLTLLAFLLLLHPSHSAPLPVPASPRPFSPSQHLRHLLARNDTRHDVEESIENSNEQQARDMQQQYQQDRQAQQHEQQQQQQESAAEEKEKKHTHHTTGHEKAQGVDRDAVVTGDDLRHPRDPKQQQKQQQQVINNGTTTPPPSEQREDRRDDEADKADEAGDMARSAEEQRREEGGEKLVDSDEVSNGTNLTAQNNGTAPIDGNTHPYDHNTQKAGMYNRTTSHSHNSTHHGGRHNGSTVAGPYNGTDGRLDQSSPYHSTDPQARTWSQQRRDPINPPANFTAPLPPNSTYPAPSNSSGHNGAYGYPQPVPSVDHAQRLVDGGGAASGSDVLESSSGSDADDEYDSQATQNSSSNGVPDREEEEEAVISEEGSSGASNGTDAPVQEPGNNVQWNVLSEHTRHSGADDDDEGSSNAAEDIRDKHNGGNRLRNEPRGNHQSHTEDERDTHDRHNGRHHLDGELRSSQPQSAVDMVDVERAVSGSSVTGWVLVLLACCVVGFGVGWWLRRVQRQQKYETVTQFDAYGDVVEDEGESESEYESQRVQVRVY